MTLHKALTVLGFERTDKYSHSAPIGRMKVIAVDDGGDRVILSAADKDAGIDDFYQVEIGWPDEADTGDIWDAIKHLHMRVYKREADLADRKDWPFK
jgi:hypothetical protein